MQYENPTYQVQLPLQYMSSPDFVSLDDMYRYYCQYQGELLGYLINRGFDRETAEDLLQDTFFKACKQVNKGVVQAQNIRAWLYSIAHNTAISRYRKKKEFLTAEIEKSGTDIATETDNTILQNDILAFVAVEFSEREREVFDLRTVQELSFQETADVLNISKTTVIRIDENNRARIKSHFGDLI